MAAPSTGAFLASARSIRVADIAVFDVVVSMAALGWLNANYGTGSFSHGAMAAIPLGVAVHWWLGIPTQLNFKLGLSAAPSR